MLTRKESQYNKILLRQNPQKPKLRDLCKCCGTQRPDLKLVQKEQLIRMRQIKKPHMYNTYKKIKWYWHVMRREKKHMHSEKIVKCMTLPGRIE